MNLRHHLSVLWRWRRVVGAGLFLAFSVAVLVTFKPTLSGGPDLKWRSEAVYTSTSRVFITQPGSPWTRATLPGSTGQIPEPQNGEKLRSFALPTRFADLAVVYAYLAQSTQVQKLISPKPIGNQILVNTIPNPATGDPLPLLEVVTTGNTPAGTKQLNVAAIDALRGYLDRQSAENDVPVEERVQLQVINPPPLGVLTGGRSPTLSVVAFLLALVATLVAAYVLENLYPRTHLSRAAAARGDDGLTEVDDQELDALFASDEWSGPSEPARRRAA
jgi:hypothetical protein